MLSKHREEVWQGGASIGRKERSNFSLTYIVHFGIILRNR